MARKVRRQCARAIYHVLNRGDRREDLTEHLDEANRLLAIQPPTSTLTHLEEKILSGGSSQAFSVAEREQFLAELGFNWNTTGDYIIVSKKSLNDISFDGMEGAGLTEAAIAILAITPEEQVAIETDNPNLWVPLVGLDQATC